MPQVQNRQLDELKAAVMRQLAGRRPEDIAANSGVRFDGRHLLAESFGTVYAMDAADYSVSPVPEMWHYLTLLQYVAYADSTQPEGRVIGLAEFREGGLVRGTSFDRENDRSFEKLGQYDPDVLKSAAARLGGKEVPGPADLCIKFSFAPFFPVIMHFWFADEDFPASGKIMLDAASEHHLKVEAAGTVGTILLTELVRQCEKA